MVIIAATLLIGALVVLHIRGFKDAAFSDPLLFLTGISLIAYVVTTPRRTKVPTAIAILAVLLFIASPYLRSPSAEQIVLQNLHEGVDAYSSDEFDRAIASFSIAIQLDPSSPEALCGRGLTYIRLQEFEKAIADFTQVIESDPTFADAYRGRGVALLEMGEDDKAIPDFTETIRLDPRDFDSFLNRGLAYFRLQEFEKAIADFAHVIESKPTLADAYRGRGAVFYEMEEDDKAILDFTEAIRLDPRDYDSFHYRALVYHFKGDQNEALTDLDACKKLGGYVDPELLNDVREALDVKNEPSD